MKYDIFGQENNMPVTYLIRHTKPLVDAGTCYGQSDLEAEPEHFKQVLTTLPGKLSGLSHATFISSPLRRCAAMAHALAGHNNIQWANELKEMHFGNWEMLPWDAIPQDQMEQWSANFTELPVPGGESFNQFSQRVLTWWNNNPPQGEQTRIITTHSGVMRVMATHLLGIPAKNIFNLEIDFGQPMRIDHHPNGYNRVTFL